VSLAYSYYLKQLELVDAFALAGLYTLRIEAGGAAVGVPVSTWLLALSVFLFLSIALAKRFTELQAVARRGGTRAAGRGYRTQDIEQLARLGTAAGTVAALVLALYLNSPEVRALYRHPLWLWALTPLVLYWVNRCWLLAQRGELHEDPVIFALRDPASYVVGLAMAVAMWLAL
jgi:4-hydroxybenzoate polyprenyltransferase